MPFFVAANGPRGVEVARSQGDGVIYAGRLDNVPAGFSQLNIGSGAIILEDGEDPASPRVLEAARVAFAMSYHLAYEGFFNPRLPVERLPGGADWLRSLERHDPEVRHLVVHNHHAVGVNAHDAEFIGRHLEALAAFAAQVALTPAAFRQRVGHLRSLGATRTTISAPVLAPDWRQHMRAHAAAFGF